MGSVWSCNIDPVSKTYLLPDNGAVRPACTCCMWSDIVSWNSELKLTILWVLSTHNVKPGGALSCFVGFLILHDSIFSRSVRNKVSLLSVHLLLICSIFIHLAKSVCSSNSICGRARGVYFSKTSRLALEPFQFLIHRSEREADHLSQSSVGL